MIKIRNSVFETNSSSTHSLVIIGDKIGKALITAYPELKSTFEYLAKNVTYSVDERLESLEAINARLENNVLDLTNVKEVDYNFGYRNEVFYADFAHKLLFVLTMLNDCFYDYGNYCRASINSILSELGIKSVIPPKNGFTGIDHQSRDEIECAVKYNVYQFLTRRDYILVLDHD